MSTGYLFLTCDTCRTIKWDQIAKKQPDSHESFSSVFMKRTKPFRLVYKKLLSKRGQEPISSQQKWQQDIDTDQKVNWKAVYQLASHCTKSSKLIVFNFKFLHRRLSTNSFLHKLGFTDSEKCTFCLNETEHLLHLFWTCEKPSPSGIVYFHCCSPAGSLRKTLGLLRRTLLWV